MANTLTSNPMVITGSMASGYKAATASALGTLRTLMIEKIYWANPLTIGDQVIIGDTITGETLVALRCEVANQPQIIDWTARPKLWADFEINTFGSGTLYIYTRSV